MSAAGPPQSGSTAAMMRELLGNKPLLGCWLATLGGCFGLGCSSPSCRCTPRTRA